MKRRINRRLANLVVVSALLSLASCATPPPVSSPAMKEAAPPARAGLAAGSTVTASSQAKEPQDKSRDGTTRFVETAETEAGKANAAAAQRAQFAREAEAASIKASQAAVDAKRAAANGPIRFYSIGSASVITFANSTTRGAETSLVIPIVGRGLLQLANSIVSDNTQGAEAGLQVNGTVPIAEGEYEWSVLNDTVANLIIKAPYVAKLSDGDRLEVTIVGLQRAGDSQELYPVACAQRTFTLYSTDYYRKILQRRVPLHDIEAFPLPEQEATALFGPVIARDYYVVKLTLRNSRDDDRLVNVGMISATGRVLIEPREERKDIGATPNQSTKEPSFTLPIRVSPQGTTQVFAVLDAKEDRQFRARWFRALEFSGALATAGVNTFAFNSTIQKSVSLATGIAVPEMRKLWPDPWPGYKRNLVNFSMPELVKVPKSSATSPKFLFFSKNDLELILADPNIVRLPESGGVGSKAWAGLKEFFAGSRQPSVRVCSLAFDGLEIPFETVYAPVESDVREKIFSLMTETPLVRERLRAVGERWKVTDPATLLITRDVRASKVNDVNSGIKKLISTPPEGDTSTARFIETASDSEAATIKTQLQEVGKIADQLVAVSNQSSDFNKSLLGQGVDWPTLATIDQVFDQLGSLQRRIGAGSDIGVMQDQVNALGGQLKKTREAITFVETAADALGDDKLLAALTDLAKIDPKHKTWAAYKEAHAQDLQLVEAIYARLKAARTVRLVADFAPEQYQQLK